MSDTVWFISHAGADRAWAEWIAWQLMDAGHRVELDYWDWGAGDNFILKMNAALERGRLLALFSPAYFELERFTTPEWAAKMAVQEKIVPVRIVDTIPPPILRPLLAPALFGLDDHDAREALLRAVAGPARPGTPPPRPQGMLARMGGGSGPRLPGSLPRVRNLPARNAAFTGRDSLLVHLREALAAGQRVGVQALHGRGGVGKTQLAVEYAYRFAGEYELAWWIAAEDPALIPDQLAALAARIGAAPTGTLPAAAVELLLGELGERSRWLLVFDNAEDPDALASFLPGGPGHVLITSRTPHWHTHAVPLDVDTLSRTESVALLRAQGAILTDADADHISATLDDLPLALAQAAALLTRGLSPADLKEELAANLVQVMGQGHPPSYPTALAAQVRLTRTRLETDHPGAAAVVDALALLAPEPFPLTTCASHLPDQTSTLLKETVGSRLGAVGAVERVARHGLTRVQGGTLQLHRLTQDMLKGQMTSPEHDQARADAEALLTAADPGDASEPRFWPAWQVLLPHALAIAPTRLTTSPGRDVVRRACWYLMERGQPRPARERLQQLYDTCLQQVGPDHVDTLWAANDLARAYADTQDHERARVLDEDTLARRRRLYGDDDSDTLVSARNLAIWLWALGRHEEALALDEKTLETRRRVSGAEHPDTLRTAAGLAVELAEVGRVEEAVVLEEETLEVQRRVMGSEHPDTLNTAYNLANRLAAVGRVEEAVVLEEETLERRRRVLGEDHPDTLITAYNLANRLAAVGRGDEAVVLGEETLGARRRVLGLEHPDTLSTAHNLAIRLAAVGRVDEAVVLGEETLEGWRRVLGSDHPDTLEAVGLLEWLKRQQAEGEAF
ncbi:FxSxx-COOH system tetratricopeptide repeat protein [Streptomyces sp. NBC_00140]|uniref:FxSxx-COOH system tetratricopeptide repeat protein n=1 Tax=Streptomyces sp. NBC_00140 TaxID=2975664 RepID=UPI00225580FD|nr:FxSxx-COOH system tetratricopeptide repeat protein [Streptomyces sp. NBC_00140]MCX5336554.1 FxSxx-COOH system tetratricopeptide repeat protein [Streptomyces sp. NBC_00140]